MKKFNYKIQNKIKLSSIPYIINNAIWGHHIGCMSASAAVLRPFCCKAYVCNSNIFAPHVLNKVNKLIVFHNLQRKIILLRHMAYVFGNLTGTHTGI